MVKVISLLIVAESALEFTFGAKTPTEIKYGALKACTCIVSSGKTFD